MSILFSVRAVAIELLNGFAPDCFDTDRRKAVARSGDHHRTLTDPMPFLWAVVHCLHSFDQRRDVVLMRQGQNVSTKAATH